MPSLNPRTSMFVALVAAGFLATIACSSSSSSPSSAPQANAGTEAAGGEVIVPYTDSRFHYRIDAPGRMTANPDGTAAYLGPSDRLEITIVQGSAASNPGALASQDIKSLSTAATAFHQLSNPTTLTLNGHQVTRFSYTWNAGTSAVTGKEIALTSVRYYVAKDATTLAVITYGTASNQFDAQGADDIASTFQWQ